MAAAEMTVTVQTKKLFPNFVVSAWLFSCVCARLEIRVEGATGRPWRVLLVGLRIGGRVWYYSSDPRADVEVAGGHSRWRRVFKPPEEAG